MKAAGTAQKFEFRKRVAAAPDFDHAAIEQLLARLVAQAYAADHPEMFSARRKAKVRGRIDENRIIKLS